jgi:hypothetical protein
VKSHRPQFETAPDRSRAHEKFTDEPIIGRSQNIDKKEQTSQNQRWNNGFDWLRFWLSLTLSAPQSYPESNNSDTFQSNDFPAFRGPKSDIILTK